MNEKIITLLQWLIPSGSVVSLFAWMLKKESRKVKDAREMTEMHNAYKVMYNDVRETLIEIQNEKRELRRLLTGLERAVGKCYTCRYYVACPALLELQKYKGNCPAGDGRLAYGQRKTDRRPRDNTGEPGDASDSDGRPP
jgi:hypothetical protein